jgi:hypothetical protein
MEHIDETFVNFYKELEQRMGNIIISPDTLLLIVRHTIEFLEEKSMPSDKKKQLALNLIDAFIINSKLQPDQKTLCLSILDTTLSDTIDLIIDASRGKININQLKTTTTNCFLILFTRIFK